MENVGLIEVGALATLIMGIVQLIVGFIPNVNKRVVTLVVSLVLSVIAIVSVETIGYIEAILAVLGQVFVYDFIVQPIRESSEKK
jgi:hypothetical protein